MHREALYDRSLNYSIPKIRRFEVVGFVAVQHKSPALGAGLGRPATGVSVKYNRSTLEVTIADPHKVLNGFAGRQLLLTGYTFDAALRLNVCLQASVQICQWQSCARINGGSATTHPAS